MNVRWILAVAFGLCLTVSAEASCVCRCVDGGMHPLCTSSMELPPICPITVCPIVPLTLAPLPPIQLPPLGASQCSQRQVLDPATGQYEWRSVCDQADRVW